MAGLLLVVAFILSLLPWKNEAEFKVEE